jgi:parallel beta-helix repeat protein
MEPKRRFPPAIGPFCLILLCLTLTVWFLHLPNTFAGEGKTGPLEISQKDVPLVITRPGSYRLISNLVISSVTASAILIDADNVTIDLDGFTIAGPGKNIGDGFGINTTVRTNVVVVNGTVRDFGLVGVHLPGQNNRVENVRVYSTGSDGIFVGHSSVVTRCQVAFCFSGINTDDGSSVLDNTIYQNDHIGIFTSGDAPGPQGGVTVIGNNCRLNGIGIKGKGQGNRIEGNTLTENGIGIDLLASTASYFAKNLLQANETAIVGDGDDTNGSSINPALSNIVLP